MSADGLETDASVALTCQLIARRSLTPDDAGCQALLGERLRNCGFAVHALKFGQTSNLWATHGSGAPVLAFVGHTDVVPSGPLELWSSDPFVAEARAGRLYGRGAADMKSGVAAALTAMERVVAAHPNHQGTLAMLMTSDEEGPATDGVVKVMAWLAERGIALDYALIGEPSSAAQLGDRIRVGRRGSLHMELTVQGIQGHVAYPEKARNPIHQFAPALAELSALQFDQGNAHFPPTSMQIYEIQAGAGANNVIPGSLKLKFNFRFGTASTVASLLAQVHALLGKHGLSYDLQHRLSSAAFLTQQPTLIEATSQAIYQILGIQAIADTGGGTSDGRFIAPTGTQVVELGPVNESIHKIDEYVCLADIAKLSATYARIFELLLVTAGAHSARPSA